MFDKETITAIIKVADKYNIEAAALLAVVDVESAGTPFWTVNGKPKPAVRFEGHYFYQRLNDVDRATAVETGLANPKAGAVKNPNSFAARYTLIANASRINREAAYESVSWGLGQVMGAHWQSLGYASVVALVEACDTIEGQVDLMVRFIEQNDLRRYLEKYDWTAFSKRYNGPGYKANKYDTKMAEAYSSYKNFDITTTEDAPPVATPVDEMIQMQTMLNKIGEYKLEEDGLMGPKTKMALRDFQLKNGLKVDGLYGPITRAELEKDYIELANKNTQGLGVSGSAIATAGTALAELAKQVEPLAKVSQIAQWVFLAILIIGVGITIKVSFFPKKA